MKKSKIPYSFKLEEDGTIITLKTVIKDNENRSIDYEFWLSEIAGNIKESNKKIEKIINVCLLNLIINGGG